MKFGESNGDDSAKSGKSLAEQVSNQTADVTKADDAVAEEGDNGPAATQQRLDVIDDAGETATEQGQIMKGGTQVAETDKSAEDLGVDQPVKTDLAMELAVQDAANRGVTTESGETVYTSHPVANLHVGPYHFENGTLRLKGEQVSEFDELLKTLPMSEQSNIAKLDPARVDEIVKARQEQMQSATQQFDSSVGREFDAKLARDNPRVGTKAIDEAPAIPAHANVAQQDGNVDRDPETLDPIKGV